MEEKIKNFDRNIEQIMNETAVAPPFGMWNRISASLDAESLPIAAAAPASIIPKRAVISLAALALILAGSLVTAYLMNNQPVAEMTNSSYHEVGMEQKENVIPVVVIDEIQPVVGPVTKKLFVSKPVVAAKETVKEGLPVSTTHFNRTEVAVPDYAMANNSTAGLEAYYFPPVDVNNAAATKTATASNIIEEDDDQPVVAEKKIKPASTSSHEKKLRPKKKRGGSFNYGRINRYKEPK